MNLDFMFDWAFWIVLFALAIGVLAVAFFYPQKTQDLSVLERYQQAEENRIVVYVKAKTYEEALKELEKDYLRNGWYVSVFDYDAEKKLFIFVLRKEVK